MPTRSNPNPSATAAHARSSTVRARNSPPASARARACSASSWMWGFVAMQIPVPRAYGDFSGAPRAARPREDLLDDLGLRVRVVLNVPPFAPRELAFRLLVELAVGVVASQVVAEVEHAVDLRAVRREHMQVD